MRAAELRAIRHMALSIADQCAALLELVDGATPNDPPAANQEPAPKEVVEASEGLPAMLGPRGRSQQLAAEAAAPATGTDAGKTSD